MTSKTLTSRAEIGSLLRTLRRKKGKRQKDVAREVGVTPGYLCQLEHGIKDVSADMLIKLSAPLGVDSGALLLKCGRMQLPGFAHLDSSERLDDQLLEEWRQLGFRERRQALVYMQYLHLRAMWNQGLSRRGSRLDEPTHAVP